MPQHEDLSLSYKPPECSCGSGEYPEAVYDGYGIYLCKACDKCKAEKLSGYRKDIFERYDCDEDVESDGFDEFGCPADDYDGDF